ncbi:MAG: hypothetical protein R3C16_10165 [Hyphomonadaceae bacterium]
MNRVIRRRSHSAPSRRDDAPGPAHGNAGPHPRARECCGVSPPPTRFSATTRETVIIAPRFNGLPGSGNGYVWAAFAGARDRRPAQASLRAPPPLGETQLTLTADGAHAALYHGEALIAEASAAPSFTLTAPPAEHRRSKPPPHAMAATPIIAIPPASSAASPATTV